MWIHILIFIFFQMHFGKMSVLFILTVACLTVSLVKGDCSSCCHGKWNQCLTGCPDFNTCSAQCNTEKENCQNGCPGSCTDLDNPPSFLRLTLDLTDSSSAIRPKKLKLKRKLKKLLKRFEWKH